MKIAIVTPRTATGERGGAESLYEGLTQALRAASQDVKRVEALLDESSFEALLASYLRFYELDLSDFDLVISTKGPTYMVRHPNHISYLLHTTRVFYDMFEHEYGAGTPEHLKQRALIHRLDQLALHPDGVRAHFANGNETFRRLQTTDSFWREIHFQALHHPSALTDYREPRAGEYVLLPGRLHRWKRGHLVIEAYRHMRSDIPLKVVGTGEDEALLREQAARDPRIEFLGQVDDAELVDLYAGALVVPFVPIGEDYGLITIEAFNSGKPVITCSDSGEPLHFVKDFETGFVVEPDPRAIAGRIDFLAAHPSHAETMGLEGRRRVADITWERVVSTMLAEGRKHATRTPLSRPSVAQRPASSVGAARRPEGQEYRVAVLDMQPIEPPVGGGRLRLLGLYHGLGDELPATYLGTYDWPGPGHRRLQLSPTLEEVSVPLTNEHFVAAGQLKERAGGKTVIDVAFPQLAHHSREFVERARELASTSDVIVFSHPWVYPLVKDSLRRERQLVVYDSHNVEGELRRTLLDDGGVGTSLADSVYQLERELCESAHLILACSEDDRRSFHDSYGVPLSKIEVVPNGTFTSRLMPATPAERAAAQTQLCIHTRDVAVFIGSAYVPNEEAAAFIVEHLAPAFPDVTFLICGGVGDLPRFTGARTRDNVIFSGVIDDDTRTRFLHAATVAINPMFSGSGTNVKMFDFMAAGLPIVTTPVGARGIEEGAERVFVKCEREDFAPGLHGLLSDRSEMQRLSQKARRLVENRYSWETISRDLGTLLHRRRTGLTASAVGIEPSDGDGPARLALLSTWNAPCGIAEYTSYLAAALAREGTQPWILGVAGEEMGCEPAGAAGFSVAIEDMWRHNYVDAHAVVAACVRADITDVCIQYHTGFFEGDRLYRLAHDCKDAGMAVSVMLHDSRSMEPEQLRRLAAGDVKLMAHSEAEVDSMRPLGVPVTLLPHGLLDLPDRERGAQRRNDGLTWDPIIGSFGFLRPHKGVLKLIEALPLIRRRFANAGLLLQTSLYPSDDSREYLEACLAAIDRLDLGPWVRLDSSFLPIEDAVGRMHACDAIVVPYDASPEGASGSASICLAARRPVMTSSSAVFSALRDVTYPLPSTDSEAIAKATVELLSSPGLQRAYQGLAEAYVQRHSWDAVARQLLQITGHEVHTREAVYA